MESFVEFKTAGSRKVQSGCTPENMEFITISEEKNSIFILRTREQTHVATMNPKRYRALDIDDRASRVANFHKNTLHVVKEMIEACGLQHPAELNRRHIVRRVSSSQIMLADQLFPRVPPAALINGEKCDDPRLDVYWSRVSADSFSLSPD